MKKRDFFVMALMLALAIPSVVFAFNPPASGSLAYTIYDIAVNQILDGPIGYVGGLGLIVMGLYSAVMGQGGVSRSIICLLSGGALAGATTITSSLGFLM